jgi:flavorubredoxin
MAVQTINEGIFCIDVQHPDREMFDCLMPTEHGTTYNAYLVKGSDKTALIDTADPEFTDLFLSYINSIDAIKVDYLVVLHTEQDHSGSLTALMSRFPDAILVATEQVAKLVQTHLHIPAEKFRLFADEEELDLGGRSLRFMKIPFAHWPDNTMVFDSKSKVLFSSDLFGSHFSSDRIFATGSDEIREAARAYYAEIMMPFSPQVRKYTQKVIELAPSMIAAAHGPVWNNPSPILLKYMQWTSDKVEKTVVIPYLSMHGSSAAIMERLCIRLAGSGISVLSRNLGQKPESLSIETGHVIYDLVSAAAVIFIIPTVLGGPHPAGAYCAMITNALKPKTKFIGLLGSYGWGTRIAETFDGLTAGLKKAERLTPLLIEGLPTEDDFEKIDQYADMLTEKINGLGDQLL